MSAKTGRRAIGAVVLLAAVGCRHPNARPSPLPSSTPPWSPPPSALPSPFPTPAATPTPALPEITTANEALDSEMLRAYDRLGEGVLAYNPSLEMRQGVAREVMARVGLGPDAAGIAAGFPAPPALEPLKVSGVMEAHLAGDGGAFSIEPVGPTQERALVGGSETWTWRVTPLEAGAHTLHLIVLARIELSDKKTRKKVLTRSAAINVAVNRRFQAAAFVQKNWQWLASGATPVALITAFLAWRRRRGEGAPKGKGAPAAPFDDD